MHELSIVQGLCDQLAELAREHGARRVHRLVVEVGAISNVVPELLRQAFLAVREVDPLVAEAVLEIRERALMVECADCSRRAEPGELRFRCPHCGSADVRVVQGEELLLRDVELEIEENGDECDSARSRAGESSQVE